MLNAQFMVGVKTLWNRWAVNKRLTTFRRFSNLHVVTYTDDRDIVVYSKTDCNFHQNIHWNCL